MFDASQFDFQEKTRTYVAESSELGRIVPKSFTMSNCPEKGMHRSFTFTQCDMSGDDIAGWNFIEHDGPNKAMDVANGLQPLKVLIIND